MAPIVVLGILDQQAFVQQHQPIKNARILGLKTIDLARVRVHEDHAVRPVTELRDTNPDRAVRHRGQLEKIHKIRWRGFRDRLQRNLERNGRSGRDTVQITVDQRLEFWTEHQHAPGDNHQ